MAKLYATSSNGKPDFKKLSPLDEQRLHWLRVGASLRLDLAAIRTELLANPATANLTNLRDVVFWLQITSDLGPTEYEITFTERDWAEADGFSVEGHTANLTEKTSNDTIEDATWINKIGTSADPASNLELVRSINGLSLDSHSDEDWLVFELGDPSTRGVQSLVLNVFNSSDPMTFELSRVASGSLTPTLLASADSSGLSSPASVSLKDLAAGLYAVRVAWDQSSVASTSDRYGIYQLLVEPSRADAQIVLDGTPAGLASEAIFYANPALKDQSKRRDIILGGPGNDRLRGGSSEDWILGGDGNDVLSGGSDKQASDLIWGGKGDDIFQVIRMLCLAIIDSN